VTDERDFIDELTDYAAKMRQEYTTIDDVLEQAVEHQVKVRVARKLLVEAEHGRLQFSNALRPFLPQREPVALSEAPAGYSNGQTGFDSEAEFFGHEPAAEWADILRRAG
jgi:hypothetical protein